MDILKSHFNKIKDKLTKTELQRKLKEATSNEHCHANVSLLDDISSKTSNYTDFNVIVNHCVKKMECKKEKWRKILKTLFLIEHILKTGSPNFVDSMRSEIYKLKNLNSFSFIDTNRTDKGETIREKSKNIVKLLEDKKRLKEERDNYSKWKGRIESVGSSGKNGSSVSSQNYNPSSVSNDTYGGYNDKKNVKEDSSSSEDESEKKNKKKTNKKVVQEEESSEDEKVESKVNNQQFDNIFENNTTTNTTTINKKQNVGLSQISIKKPGQSNITSTSTTQQNTNLLFNPFENTTQNVNTTQSNQNAFDDIFGVGNTVNPVNPVNTQHNVINSGNTNIMNDIFAQNTNTQVNTNDLFTVNQTTVNTQNNHQVYQNVNQNKNNVADLLKDAYGGGMSHLNNNQNQYQQHNQFNQFNNQYQYQQQYQQHNQYQHNQYQHQQQNQFNNQFTSQYNPNPQFTQFNQPSQFTQQQNTYTAQTTSTWNKQPQNNDDDFKEVEEEDNFKIGKTFNLSNQNNKGGLNNLLDPKLVNLSDLGKKKNTNTNQNMNTYNNNTSTNYNFNF